MCELVGCQSRIPSTPVPQATTRSPWEPLTITTSVWTLTIDLAKRIYGSSSHLLIKGGRESWSRSMPTNTVGSNSAFLGLFQAWSLSRSIRSRVSSVLQAKSQRNSAVCTCEPQEQICKEEKRPQKRTWRRCSMQTYHVHLAGQSQSSFHLHSRGNWIYPRWDTR